MASDSDVDTERTVVRTYVPAYQRDQWDTHAESLDMSRSEFVRSMVQAGRRGFGADLADQNEQERNPIPEDGSSPQKGLENTVQSLLEESGCLSWEELFQEIAGDIEQRLEGALQELQDQDRVRYSGPEGGYVLEES